MRGYVAREMQFGAMRDPSCGEVEVITPAEHFTDLILNLGNLPGRKTHWDIFFVEGTPLSEQSMKLGEQYAAIKEVAIKVQYILMQGSLVYVENGFSLYQRFTINGKTDIPF